MAKKKRPSRQRDKAGKTRPALVVPAPPLALTEEQLLQQKLAEAVRLRQNLTIPQPPRIPDHHQVPLGDRVFPEDIGNQPSLWDEHSDLGKVPDGLDPVMACLFKKCLHEMPDAVRLHHYRLHGFAAVREEAVRRARQLMEAYHPQPCPRPAPAQPPRTRWWARYCAWLSRLLD